MQTVTFLCKVSSHAINVLFFPNNSIAIVSSHGLKKHFKRQLLSPTPIRSFMCCSIGRDWARPFAEAIRRAMEGGGETFFCI